MGLIAEESVEVELTVAGTIVVETTEEKAVTTDFVLVELAAVKVKELVTRSGFTVPERVVAAAKAVVGDDKVAEDPTYQKIRWTKVTSRLKLGSSRRAHFRRLCQSLREIPRISDRP